MWLRKRLRGRRVTGHVAHWASRRLALALTPGPEDDAPWLVLDLAQGPSLARDLEPGFGDEPHWPTLDRAAADPEVWREFPHISPALRRALDHASPSQAAAVWRAVRSGGCGPFWVHEGGAVLAWPPGGDEAASWRETSTAMEAAGAAGRRAPVPGPGPPRHQGRHPGPRPRTAPVWRRPWPIWTATSDASRAWPPWPGTATPSRPCSTSTAPTPGWSGWPCPNRTAAGASWTWTSA